MSDIEVVKLNDVERKTFINFGIFILLVSFMYINLHWLRLGHDYREYARSELLAAHDYVSALPKSAAPTLFASNWRHFLAYGEKDIAQQAIAQFRKMQAATYPKFMGGRISVIVQPHFLAASASQRLRFLDGSDLRHDVVSSLIGAPNERSGCFAEKFEYFGWTNSGYVLADPVDLNGEPNIIRCIEAGLSFVSGLPIRGETFNLSNMPSASVATIVLDYTMRCSYDGVSDEEEPNQSNAGITSKPSIACIRGELETALKAAQP